MGVRVGGVGVGVVGDEVLDRGEVPVIEVTQQAHEVRRHGDVGGDLTQDVDLELEEFEQGVRREPLEVEQLRRIDRPGRLPGHLDVLPRGVALAPDVHAPRLVEAVEVAVARLEPAPEVRG